MSSGINGRGEVLLVLHPSPKYHFQTWDGEVFYTRTTYDDLEEAIKNLEYHKWGMPNCPARVLMETVLCEYQPKRATDSRSILNGEDPNA